MRKLILYSIITLSSSPVLYSIVSCQTVENKKEDNNKHLNIELAFDKKLKEVVSKENIINQLNQNKYNLDKDILNSITQSLTNDTYTIGNIITSKVTLNSVTYNVALSLITLLEDIINVKEIVVPVKSADGLHAGLGAIIDGLKYALNKEFKSNFEVHQEIIEQFTNAFKKAYMRGGHFHINDSFTLENIKSLPEFSSVLIKTVSDKVYKENLEAHKIFIDTSKGINKESIKTWKDLFAIYLDNNLNNILSEDLNKLENKLSAVDLSKIKLNENTLISTEVNDQKYDIYFINNKELLNKIKNPIKKTLEIDINIDIKNKQNYDNPFYFNEQVLEVLDKYNHNNPNEITYEFFVTLYSNKLRDYKFYHQKIKDNHQIIIKNIKNKVHKLKTILVDNDNTESFNTSIGLEVIDLILNIKIS